MSKSDEVVIAYKGFTVGYVGEGVEANVWYRADNAGKLVKVNQC